MNTQFKLAAALVSSVCFLAASAQAQTTAAPARTKGTVMKAQAIGTFEVTVKPLPEDQKVPGVAVGRLSIDKEWRGDLVGTSKGEMMTADTTVKGSGGYVAVEAMTVSLKGRSGTFALMHHATMKNGGDFRMLINVVPDSGTGDLTGLTGNLEIIIEGSKHSYKFDYTLPGL
jgi:hypothetical protein